MPRSDIRLRLHIHFGDEHSLGPGKAALLEAIERTGSISAAARELGMAYRHAWELIDDLNACFAPGVIEAAAGGAAGGGARLTPFGRALARRFRTMEERAAAAIGADLAALEKQRARGRKRSVRGPSAPRRPRAAGS